MTESTVAVVRDKNGLVHHAARASDFVQDGLASGELVDMEVERANAADAATGDSADPKPTRSRSGDRAATKPSTD
jgi:hypothetical protein